jgi:hypothetical protein
LPCDQACRIVAGSLAALVCAHALRVLVSVCDWQPYIPHTVWPAVVHDVSNHARVVLFTMRFPERCLAPAAAWVPAATCMELDSHSVSQLAGRLKCTMADCLCPYCRCLVAASLLCLHVEHVGSHTAKFDLYLPEVCQSPSIATDTPTPPLRFLSASGSCDRTAAPADGLRTF